MPTFSKTNSAVLTFRFAIAAVLLAGIATFGTACGGSGSNGSDDNGNGSPGTTAPAAPSDLSGTSGDKRVRLDWSAVSEAETYTVYRSTSSSTDPSDNDPLATGVSDPAYTDMGVQNGTTYYYVVTSVGSDGNESAPSNEVSKTPFSEPVGRP